MLKQIIYKHFDSKRIENENREKTVKKINFAPSYVEKCKRQIFYNKSNIPVSNPIEAHSYIKFAMGDNVHLAIQDILKSIGIWIEGEDFKEIEWNDLDWIYRIDGKLKVDDNEYIIEIKTVYSSGYNQIEKKAKKEHELQLLLYMIFEKVDRGIILYIGRDNGHTVEYNYLLDQLKEKYFNYFKVKLKELKELKTMIENNQMPDRDFNIVLKNNNGNIVEYFQKNNIKYKSDWQCNYCNWKGLCWQKELEEIKSYEFYIDREFIGKKNVVHKPVEVSA